MRALSASIVLLAGMVLGSTALAVDPAPNSRIAGAVGGVVALIGVIGWLVAFFSDKGRA